MTQPTAATRTAVPGVGMIGANGIPGAVPLVPTGERS
jgi:hypothetical protein